MTKHHTVATVLVLSLVLAVGAGGRAVAQARGNGMMGPGMMDQGMMGHGMQGHGMMGGYSGTPPSGGGGGAAIFASQCAACHTLSATGSGAGPNLHDLFGRRAGSVSGYQYSPAMRRSGIVWDEKTLDAFLEAPQRVVPGNRMPYSGLPDAAQRQALIAYLHAATR